MAAQQEDPVWFDAVTDIDNHPVIDPNPPACSSSGTASATAEDVSRTSHPTASGTGQATLSTNEPGTGQDTVHGQGNGVGLSRSASITSPPASEESPVPGQASGSGASPSTSATSPATPLAIRPASVPAPSSSSQDPFNLPGAAATDLSFEEIYALWCSYNPERAGTPSTIKGEELEAKDEQLAGAATTSSPRFFGECDNNAMSSSSYDLERKGTPTIKVEETTKDEQLAGAAATTTSPRFFGELENAPSSSGNLERKRKGTPSVKGEGAREGQVEKPKEGQLSKQEMLMLQQCARKLEVSVGFWLGGNPALGDGAGGGGMEDGLAVGDEEDADEEEVDEQDMDQKVAESTKLKAGDSGSPEAKKSEALEADDSAAPELDKPNSPTENVYPTPGYRLPGDERSSSDIESEKEGLLNVLKHYRSHHETASMLLDIDIESVGVEEIGERLEKLREWLQSSLDWQDIAKEIIVGALDKCKKHMEWLESMRALAEGGDEEKERAAARVVEELRGKLEELRYTVDGFDSEFFYYRSLKTYGDVHRLRVAADDYMGLKDQVGDLVPERDALAAEKLSLEEALRRERAEREEEKVKWTNEMMEVKGYHEASKRHVFDQVYMIRELDDKVEKLEDEKKALKEKLCEKEYLELKERNQTPWAKRELWEDLQRENFRLKVEVVGIQELKDEMEMLREKNKSLEDVMERLERRNAELLVQTSVAELERQRLEDELARKTTKAASLKERNTKLEEREKRMTEIYHEAVLGCGVPKDAAYPRSLKPSQVRSVKKKRSFEWRMKELKRLEQTWLEEEKKVAHTEAVPGAEKEMDEGKPAAKEDRPQTPAWEDDPLAGEDIYNASPPAKKDDPLAGEDIYYDALPPAKQDKAV